MANSRKDQVRTSLLSAIFQIATEMRGSVESMNLNQCVLEILLYRFISEQQCLFINNLKKKSGAKSFNYATLKDNEAESTRDLILEEKGFFILPSELFENVCKQAKSEVDLRGALESIFRNIEVSTLGTASESKLKGLFDNPVFNNVKLGSTNEEHNDRLIQLLNTIDELPIKKCDAKSIDLFGFAYECLIEKHTSSAGMSEGKHFTPQEVSELLVRLVLAGKKAVDRVYDPACGTGSLLLKFADVLGKENIRNGYFGQEINSQIYNLCRINMILHDISYKKFDFYLGNTLTDPSHKDVEPFEAIVCNNSYSTNWDGIANQDLINDKRFAPAGILAPKTKADIAFGMHVLSRLDKNGAAAIVLLPGVMSRVGPEQKIRKYLIDNNFVDAVIQLPKKLFYDSTYAACILVMKKNKSDNKVLFINASNEFVPDTIRNKLKNDQMQRIIDCYTSRETQKHFSRLVEQQEIADKNFVISADNYVKSKVNVCDTIDIEKLNDFLKEIEVRQNKYRLQVNAITDGNNLDHNVKKLEKLVLQHCKNETKINKLKEIFTIKNGYVISNSDFEFQNGGTIPWFRSNDIRKSGMVLSKSKVNITRETAKSMDMFPANSIIITTNGHGFRHALITVPHLANRTFKSLSLRPEFSRLFDMRFINYCFTFLDNWHSMSSTSDSHNFVNYLEFEQCKFAAPPIEIQLEIIDILDRFNNLESAVEEELELRRRQQDYFLNSLFSFEEDEANVGLTVSANTEFQVK